MHARSWSISLPLVSLVCLSAAALQPGCGDSTDNQPLTGYDGGSNDGASSHDAGMPDATAGDAAPAQDTGAGESSAGDDSSSSGDDSSSAVDSGSDAASEAAADGPVDSPADVVEASSDAPHDAPHDAPVDAPVDAPADAPAEASADAAGDAGSEASSDASADGGTAGQEVWVLRVGATGSATAPGNLATAVFVDRIAVADGSARGTIALPTAASGSDQPLTMSGSATSEGQLTRSTDGHHVILAGYAATPGTGDTHADGAVTGIKDTSTTGASAVLRVIGTVDASGTVSTTFTTTAYSGNNIRGAATTDGTAFWMFGDGSGAATGMTYQATGGGTPTSLSTGVATDRAGAIFGGRLYGTTASGSVRGIFTMVSALPTAAETASILPGFPTTTGPSSYGFVGLALQSATDVDTFYVCDDRSSANGGGVQRWTLGNGTWTLSTTFNDSMTSGCRGITAYVDGTNVVLLVTTTETTGNRLLELVDTTAGLATTTATKLADAPANTVFRGVALAPN